MRKGNTKTQSIEKGQYNYIDTRKKAQGRKSILMFLISASIFILGLCFNDFNKNNVFTIVAAVSVLPATKMLISYIILAPYHSVRKELYDKVANLIAMDDTCYTDVVFTSTEKVMYLAFLIVIGEEVIGLVGRSKEDKGYISNYLSQGIKKRGLNYNLTIYDEENKFMKRLREMKHSEADIESVKELKDYIKSLMV